MDKKEFQAFIKMIDEAYPTQASLNQVQKGFFWLALQDHDFDECVMSLANHTKHEEWKPKVCDILVGLNSTDDKIAKLFSDFFNNKEVKDDVAVKIYKSMGGQTLNRTLLEKDYKRAEKDFVDQYNNEMSKRNYNNLPNDLRTKLVGVIKRRNK